MTKLLSKLATLAIIAFATTLIPILEAQAGRYKAKCRGPYQLVQGNWISSPICEDRVLAKVARSYGNNVRAKHVRKYAGSKIGICFAYGHDIRLSGICGAYRNIGRR